MIFILGGMIMENDNKKFNANELDGVSGGKIIEGTDGKFYVVPENTLSFKNKEDAENVDKFFNNIKDHKPKIYPHGPMHRHNHLHLHDIAMMKAPEKQLILPVKTSEPIPPKNDIPPVPTNDLPNAPKND